jgi:succinate dehydrogenase / fumarate reductase membrane anchor subunit
MVMRRAPVGAHYGLGDWLVQRLSAIVIALYALMFIVVALAHGGFDYALWRSLFASGAFRLASFIFMAALLYHAWVGAREIFMDYVKPTWLRVAVYAVTIALLAGYLGWAIQILWGRT